MNLSGLFKKILSDKPNLAQRQTFAVAKKKTLPSLAQWRQLPRILSKTEKHLLQFSGLVIILCVVTLAVWYTLTHQIEVKAAGGSYTEALIGQPQLINPLYASATDVDSDLAYLVYSGLMSWQPQKGLVTDLAENFILTQDGKSYQFLLKEDARFHNGEMVRARDVVFTITAIQNPAYRSPLAPAFHNVTVSQVDDRTVLFELKEPSAGFLANLTVGILPANIWSEIAPQNAMLASRNLEPVGSGPYRFAEFSKDKKASIRSYTLQRYERYYGDQPYIDTLTFKFYADAEAAMQALQNRNVEGLSFVSPEQEPELTKNRLVQIVHPLLQRQVVLFFNQEKQPLLKTKDIRQAITLTIDKQTVLDDVLQGNGRVLNSPLLPELPTDATDPALPSFDREQANSLLEKLGYAWNAEKTVRMIKAPPAPKAKKGTPAPAPIPDTELTLVITTVQSPEFISVAENLVKQLQLIGIKASINPVAADHLFSDIIETRNYELLLTGALLGVYPDPYPFWHSSQSKGTGLNLSGYANRDVDTLLEEARLAVAPEVRQNNYQKLRVALANDLPAVFLYQSTYTYAPAAKIKNLNIEQMVSPADRFAKITDWYVKTKKVLQ